MKKVLIVSSDDIILYQPTILNLYDYLKNDFEIQIISFEPEFLGRQKDNTRDIIYFIPNKIKKKIFRIIDLLGNAVFKRINKYLFRLNFRLQFLRRYKCSILIRELKKQKADHIIAVDIMPLYAVQKIFGGSHFLSLEILPDDSYRKLIDERKIKSVIIQNQQRFDYLFENIKPKVFYVQNAPFCGNICTNDLERHGLVWGGTIAKTFAVFDFINFIKTFSQYQGMLKGAAPFGTLQKIKSLNKKIIDSGRLIINTDYLPVNELINFLSKYKIGFCFYDWRLIENNFNYQTAPSGRLFMYLAAGVPVIACDIPGFKFINEYKAGVLIKDYAAQTILKAVETIEADYFSFQKNAYKAFSDFCFDKNMDSFKTDLMGN